MSADNPFPWQAQSERQIAAKIDADKYDRIYEEIEKRYSRGMDPGRVIFHGNALVFESPVETVAPSKFGRPMNLASKSIGKIERKRVGGTKTTVLPGPEGNCADGNPHRWTSKGAGRLRCTKCRKTTKTGDSINVV